MGKQLGAVVANTLSNLPPHKSKAVMVTPEMESDEKKISTDPKELLEQAKKLREKSAQLAWLLGMRLAKIRAFYDENKYRYLDEGNTETWYDFCQNELKLSHTTVNNLIRFYGKITWVEANTFQFEFSKALPLAAIEAPEERKELAERIETEGLTKEMVNEQVRLINQKKLATQVADKKEKKPQNEPQVFCVQIKMLGKEHVDSCQVARKGNQMIIKLDLPEGEAWPEEIVISPQK